jgi:NADH-quinone oxidoreductase subunit L
MTIPLIVLAVLSVLGGFVGIPEVFASDAHSLEHFLAPIFAESAKIQHGHHLSHTQEYIMMGVSTILIIGIILFAVSKFKKTQAQQTESSGIAKLLENKWYVDELYDTVIVKPLHLLSVFLKNIVEKSGIDGAVNGVGKLVGYGSRQLRLLQSGQVGNYLLIMVMIMIVFVLIWFNDLTIMNFLKKLF